MGNFRAIVRRLHCCILGLALAVTIAACGGSDTNPAPNSSPSGSSNPPANAPPQISGIPASTVVAGTTYSFVPIASDATGNTLTFSIVNMPDWASFDSASGKLTGAPSVTSVGAYAGISISVSDGHATASLPPFSINVVDSLMISGNPPTQVAVGSNYTFQPAVSSAGDSPLTFAVENMPSWATFSTATGTLSGTPTSTQTGTYSDILISVSNGSASAALTAFSITVTPQGTTAPTLAAKYPGDVGIGSDAAVVLYENFEEGSVAAVVSRYDTYDNSSGMLLVTDHPPSGPGSHAMQLTAGGANSATDLYKSFGSGYDELYFRYYVKYPTSGPYHHSGLWIGGYNPPLPYPDPKAGIKPVGDDRYSLGLEPIADFANIPIDFYTYWRGMQSWESKPTGAVGDYYGNTLVHDAEFRLQSGIWQCFEIHLKLNPDPTTSMGAVLELWQNDALIRRFDDAGPKGYWIKDKFCPSDADGTECTAYRPANPTLLLLDQQWRTTSALKINYFWPQNYNDASTDSSMLLDDMIVATQRIGCTKP